MNLGNLLTFVSLAAVLAGCDATENVPQAVPERGPKLATAGKTVVGEARMASFSAPEHCQRFSVDTVHQGGSTHVRTGCVVQAGEAMVVVGLTESATPFEEAFKVSKGDIDNFRQAAAAFPREVLSEYVLELEKNALSSGEQGFLYSNKRMSLLPNNGGVEGASACVEFSFDGVSTTPPSRKSTASGLRCARFGQSAEKVEEIMIEVMSFYPENQDAPEIYKNVFKQVAESFAYK